MKRFFLVFSLGYFLSMQSLCAMDSNKQKILTVSSLKKTPFRFRYEEVKSSFLDKDGKPIKAYSVTDSERHYQVIRETTVEPGWFETERNFKHLHAYMDYIDGLERPNLSQWLYEKLPSSYGKKELCFLFTDDHRQHFSGGLRVNHQWVTGFLGTSKFFIDCNGYPYLDFIGQENIDREQLFEELKVIKSNSLFEIYALLLKQLMQQEELKTQVTLSEINNLSIMFANQKEDKND